MIERPLGGAMRRTLDALVRHVAEASVEAVCGLVAPQINSMTVSEARGYIRGRASAIVRRQAQLACRQMAGIDPAWQGQVAHHAIDRLMPHVLRQASAGRARHAEVRAFGPAMKRRAA
jgi:hypothetical protein